MVSLVLLLLSIAAFTWNNPLVSAMRIEMKPYKYDGIIPVSLNITCIPEALSNNCAKEILAIQVSKDGGRPLATLQQNAKVSYNQLLRVNLEAEGHIDKIASKSKFTVTFTEMLMEDTGMYSCTMLYLDEWGFLQQEAASSNFTVHHQNMHDIVRYLMGKLNSMEQLLLNQKKQPVEEGSIKEEETQLVPLQIVLHRQQEQLAKMEELIQSQQNHLAVQDTALQSHEMKLTACDEQLSILQNTTLKDIAGFLQDKNDKIEMQEILLESQQMQLDALKSQSENQQNQLVTQDNILRVQEMKLVAQKELLGSHQNVTTTLQDEQRNLESALHKYDVELDKKDGVLASHQERLLSNGVMLESQKTKMNALDTLVRSQEKKFKAQEQLLQSHGTRIDAQDALTQTHPNQSLTQGHSLRRYEEQLAAAEDEMTSLDRKITEYIEKDSRISAFLVGYQSYGDLKTGDVLKFSDVQQNKGNNFNEGTGVYMAPIGGLYAFHLYLTVAKTNKQMQINLVTSKGDAIIAKLFALDKEYGDQSSVSAIVELAEGETVKCVIYSMSSQSTLSHFPYTGFAGYLIKAY